MHFLFKLYIWHVSCQFNKVLLHASIDIHIHLLITDALWQELPPPIKMATMKVVPIHHGNTWQEPRWEQRETSKYSKVNFNYYLVCMLSIKWVNCWCLSNRLGILHVWGKGWFGRHWNAWYINGKRKQMISLKFAENDKLFELLIFLSVYSTSGWWNFRSLCMLFALWVEWIIAQFPILRIVMVISFCCCSFQNGWSGIIWIRILRLCLLPN